MEDACQLSERMASDKYKSSYENIAKLIAKFSSTPALDLVKFWEVVVFSWLTGNSDMHLKNFSLISFAPGVYNLSAAYDLLNVHLVINDNEELALSLDGKKSRIKPQNFINAMTKSGLNPKTAENIFKKFVKVAPKWYNFIDQSFLPEELKEEYKTIITNNLQIIER
jgi:serine/threonine-protein kinase HipA